MITGNFKKFFLSQRRAGITDTVEQQNRFTDNTDMVFSSTQGQ